MGLFTGCASGDFSSATPPSTTTPQTPNSNPPSLPPLTAASAVNDYVGTQASGSASGENLTELHLDQTGGIYSYNNIVLPGEQPDPVANSSGIFNSYYDFRNLGDTTGVNGSPGAQYYGLAIEEPSRFAFFADNSSQQVAALVPRQTLGCITPTATAAYAFMTLPTPGFTAATDAAWGTVQVGASGSTFTFTGENQYTESSTTASTGLVPFGMSTCKSASAYAEAGSFIDTPATAANGGIEVRSFLGPTGILVANLQATDANGNALPLPGVLGMISSSSAVDLSAVVGSSTKPVLYRALFYQPLSSPAVQYGFAGQSSGTFLLGVDQSVFTSTGTTGLMGAWQALSSFSFPLSATGASGTGAFVFGAPDTAVPGLFQHAQFLYQITGACPAGTRTFATGYCSSPAVAMAGEHDGKYVVLVSGLWVPANNAPTVLMLVEE
jgi:hypothetical protein